MKINNNDPQVTEFVSSGYCKSNPGLLWKLRRRPDIQWRVLSFNNNSGIHSAFTLIGSYNKYYFIAGMEEKLVQHLTTLFHETNPNPSPEIKRVFHHVLRVNRLIKKNEIPVTDQ